MMSLRVNSPISSSTFSHLLLHKPKPIFPLSLISKPFSQTRKFSIKMSSSTQTIEHIVLFKVNEKTEPTKINTMLNRLNNLISLDQVLYLSAGPIFRNKSASSSYNFTHLLHSRYKSKEDLNGYGVHPDHQSVVKENVLPICDEIMAVDWVSNLENGSSSLVVKPGSAMKITFLKLKEGLGETEKGVVLNTISGIKNGVGKDFIEQISFGENFSPRAKGFTIGSIAVCGGVEELDKLDLNQEGVEKEKEKVRDLLDGVIVLDYVVPNSLSTANL
ncbi:stress-response A/B barrel domain-containing protein UP3-like [Papaver somniferum]|nr:stress-response A/B barrel domain-containing protein UP3-like [Papaver somniferum]